MSYNLQATVDTAKHGNGGTLNLRKTQNGKVVIAIPNKATVSVSTYSGEWIPTQYTKNNTVYTGYVKGKFLKEAEAYGGTSGGDGSCTISAIVETSKHGSGGSVNIRSNPWGTSAQVGTVGNTRSVLIDNITSTWARIQFGSLKGYVMNKFISGTDAYNRPKNDTVQTGQYGTYNVGNRYLADFGSEMTTNARYIYNYFSARGWSKNAICAMLGNMQVESKINPGLWQSKVENNDSKGFGLTQWTSAKKKILQYAYDQKKQIDDIDMQLTRISEEMNGMHGQWLSNMAGMTASTYKTSTLNVRDLADKFCKGYERPKSPDYPTRRNNAEYWYNNL